MSSYLLDTNIPIYLERPSSPFHQAVKERFHRLGNDDDLFMSILTLFELSYSQALRLDEGPHRAESIQRLMNQIDAGFPLLNLDRQSALLFGRIKAAYKRAYPSRKQDKRNIKKHDIDFMLASQALSGNHVLVSNDQVFPRIQKIFPDLSIENWAR